MNKWQKLGLAVGMGTAVVTTSHIINKFIFESATINNYTGKTVKHTYSWKFGNIAYSTYGNYDNPPLLLIHDLKSYSSGYEWDNTVHYLSKKHHLYVVDLLGCGHSDKPQITYTTYMYTQLLNDFITNVIGKKTDIIATGDSAPMVISSVYIKKDLYNKIILVSPKAVSKSKAVPGRRAGIRRRLLDIPVIGTTIYNICMRKDRLNNILSKNIFDNGIVPVDYLNAYYENAHLSGASSKFLFASTECNFTTASIAKAVSDIDNCIYIITGENSKDTSVSEYLYLNPAIEVVEIKNSNKLPQIEQPVEFAKQADIFLDM